MMIYYIKGFFNNPTPSEMEAKQLESAQRELVEALFALEHYEHRVALLHARIGRLSQTNNT